MMVVFPGSKINIGLRITGKRADGFHDIETVFYPVGLSDALEFTEAPEVASTDTLTESGIVSGCPPELNLVMRAVKSLREDHYFPFLKIHLHKAVPTGAGLGGGSADAASLLKALNRYYGFNIPPEKLKSKALQLGSDCPFFIDNIPSFALGRGEELRPVAPLLSGYYLVLLNPGVAVNTGEAYRHCTPRKPDDSLDAIWNSPIHLWRDKIFNDFESYAFSLHPLIGNLKDELYSSGAVFAAMSGSGSSVFGIFEKKPLLPEALKSYLIWKGLM